MEDHLLELFGGHDTTDPLTGTLSVESQLRWSNEALQELGKIPGFVRGKIKRNTEKFAREKNLLEIKLETMYEAKETVGA
jgi:light-independent protochlorophyllide reductase subunit B